MKHILKFGTGLAVLTLSPAAWAVFFFGNPNTNYHCSYMDKDGPDWLVEDQIAGTYPNQTPGMVTTECDAEWADLVLGSQDLDPSVLGWKFNVIVETDAHNPSPDVTECRLYADGVLHWTVEVFARL